MKKIEKFLRENDFMILYLNTVTYELNGGRGFFNDGTYKDRIYKVVKGDNEYIFHEKITGRPFYELYKENKQIISHFSQKGFIEIFDKELIT